MANFRNGETKTSTILSQHIWKLKDVGTDFTIKWKILERGGGYNDTTKSCRLCLLEKHHILFDPEGASLNRRSELFNSCTHRARLRIGKGRKKKKKNPI